MMVNSLLNCFDSNNEKITEYEVTTHGEAYFSNLPVGYYFLRVLEFSEDDPSNPTVWAIEEILISNNLNEVRIVGLQEKTLDYEADSQNESEIEAPDETCNCVAFRLDNVQDYYLPNVQTELINLFVAKNAPLTIGIIGQNLGSDEEIINFLKRMYLNMMIF